MNEQQLQQAFIQYLAQKYQLQSEEDLKQLAQELGEEGLQQEYQEFMQMMQQQQAQSARFGAKLNYINKLRAFKAGGNIQALKCGGKKKKVQKCETGAKPQRTVRGTKTVKVDPETGDQRATIKWNDGTQSRMVAGEEGTTYYGRRGEVGITNVPNARQNAIADSLYRADGWGRKTPMTFPIRPVLRNK